MTNDEIVIKTENFLKNKFANESGDHDYWHMFRVLRLSRQIASTEPTADLFTVELAALLHDIADWKFNGGDEEAGPREARKWLEGLNVGETVIMHIEEILRNISSVGARSTHKLDTIEGQIVHDADKLDALGAIGIARVFTMSTLYNEVFHDPSIPVPDYATVEEYKKARGADGHTVINHFHEKLFRLKDRMLTKTGQTMAIHRHQYMEDYVKEFLEEWDGKF